MCIRDSGIRLDGRNQRDTQPDRFQLAIHAQMVASERTGPSHGNPQNGSACYFATPVSGFLPSTAFRQRP